MEYIGDELTLFEHAKNWKNYWSSSILEFIRGDVLEVGAGLGGSTAILTQKSTYDSWNCLEPDIALANQITEKIKNRLLPERIKIIPKTLHDLETTNTFDSILYIDVLEHIEQDKQELALASKFLKPNGFIIVLAPAHNYLFSPFDKAIGHFRRYDKCMIKACTPSTLTLISNKYYDSLGLFLSLANKWFLKQSSPSLQQIRFWDKTVIPISKVSDAVLFNQLGKTIIGVWQKK